MPRDIAFFLGDILEHIANIEEFLAGHDKQCRQSVYWSLFAISEGVTEVQRQDASLDTEITDHRDIRSAQNLLAHRDFASNHIRTWDTCENSLPVLKAEIIEISKRFA
jgi:uncharacterized protein with HEPN domain